MRLTAHVFQTLDGVMQSPGGPDEDTDGGFTAGGWVMSFADEDFGRIVESWFERAEAFLFGRTTWEAMQGFWPQVTDPADQVAATLNSLPEYLFTSRSPSGRASALSRARHPRVGSRSSITAGPRAGLPTPR